MTTPKRVSPFQEIDPWSSEDLIAKRRNLPHLEVPGATYFVTFRSILTLLPVARDLIVEEIRGCDGKNIELDAAVAMPDHVHLLFRLFERENLSRVLKLIKGRSGRRINQVLKRRGKLWIEESFDRIVRNEAELEEKIEYIRCNPVKRGLVYHPEDYGWLVVKRSVEIKDTQTKVCAPLKT
jgi:REP element-mobilizing transposase RayT